MTQDDRPKQGSFFGTKEFKSRFSAGGSTQASWRKKGMPYYRVPNSTKILYKEEEVLEWLTSQKSSSAEV
jgi:hypothetical protein